MNLTGERYPGLSMVQMPSYFKYASVQPPLLAGSSSNLVTWRWPLSISWMAVRSAPVPVPCTMHSAMPMGASLIASSTIDRACNNVLHVNHDEATVPYQ